MVNSASIAVERSIVLSASFIRMISNGQTVCGPIDERSGQDLEYETRLASEKRWGFVREQKTGADLSIRPS
jgi:hypothetical protein